MSEPSPEQNSWSKTNVPRSAPPIAPKITPSTSDATRKFNIVLGSIAAVFAGLVIAFNLWYNAKPTIVLPVRPSLPVQNGFPLLKTITLQIKRKKDIDDATSRSPKQTWSLAQKREMIRANQAVLQETRAALKLPYLDENHTISSQTSFPHFARFRSLARILALAGQIAWEDKLQKEASNDYVDAITLGRRIPHQTRVLGRRVGITCEYIGRKPLWNHLSDIDPDVAEQVLVRLNTLQSERLPLAVTLAEEKYSAEHMAVEVYERSAKANGPTDQSQDEKDIAEGMRAYSKIVPKTVVVQTMNDYMDKLIEQSKKPYPISKKTIPEPKELISMLLISNLAHTHCSYVANEAGDTLLRTGLALKVYKSRNGKYPASLTDLVTAKLLPTIPEDPFALPGVLLPYKLLPDGKYLLYSIGPDSVDNGGQGILTGAKTGKQYRTVDEDSVGDIVVGWYPY